MLEFLRQKPTYPDHLRATESSGHVFFDSARMAMDASEVSFVLNEQSKLHSRNLQVLKFSGFLSVFTGAVAVIHGVKEVDLADRVNDFSGKIMGWLHCGFGGMQLTGGTAYAGMGLLSVASLITSAKVITVVSTLLEGIGGVALSTGSLTGSLLLGMQLKFLIDGKREFERILEKSVSSEEAIATLRKQLLNPDQGVMWKKVLSQALLQEIVGENSSSSEVLDKVKTAINSSLILTSVAAVLSVITAVVGIVSLISVSTIAPWMIALATIAVALSWAALDGLAILQNIQSGHVDGWEKGGLYLLTTFTFAITSLSAVLAADLFFGASSAMIGIALLIVQLFTIYKMNSEKVSLGSTD